MTSPSKTPTHTGSARCWAYRIVGALCALFGLLFVGGGAYLASLGGSLYFAVAGVLLLVAGVLLWRGQRAGAWLYALALIGSAAWAVWEAGWSFWPLVSRLFALGVLGLLVALVVPMLPGAVRRGRAWATAAVLAIVLAVAFAGMFVPHAPVVAQGNGPGLTAVDPASAQKNWTHYGNTEGGSRFAALDDIHRGNV